MNKIKLLKKYTYKSICNIDFNVLIYFDYDDEKLLFTLEYTDNDYSSSDFLDEYASNFDEIKINDMIKSFMLDNIWAQINCHINGNDYNDWSVYITDNGWKLANEKANKWFIWNVYDDDDYEIIKDKMIKFLDLNNQN